MTLLVKLTNSDTLQLLQEKIALLESKIDSLQKFDEIKTLSIKLNEQANIVSNVNSFYDSAWIKLIFVITILGIIIPILIQYFQKNNLKVVIDYLTKEINNNVDSKINELTTLNQSQSEKLSIKIDTEINRLSENHSMISNEMEASLFYLQGKSHLSIEKYDLALRDFCKSTMFWVKTTKPERAIVSLENISSVILKFKTKTEFDNACKNRNIKWDEFMSDIANVSEKSGLTH